MNTITRNNRNFTLAAVAAACLAAVTVGAHADEAVDGVPTRTIHYSDLNLSTTAGAAVLYRRIRQAAEQVCGYEGTQSVVQQAPAKACVNRAVLASVRSVNIPMLTSEYNTRAGVAQPITLATAR